MIQDYMRPQGPQTHITEEYVSSPPALIIVDEAGLIWTLGQVAHKNTVKGEYAFDVLCNGQLTGEIASRIERRRGKVWGWTATGWVLLISRLRREVRMSLFNISFQVSAGGTQCFGFDVGANELQADSFPLQVSLQFRGDPVPLATVVVNSMNGGGWRTGVGVCITIAPGKVLEVVSSRPDVQLRNNVYQAS